MDYLKKILNDPMVIYDYILGNLTLYIYKLRSKIITKGNIIFIGKPIFEIKGKAKLILGKNILFRSRNRGYHLNLLAPCKIKINPNGSIIIGDNTRIYGSCLHSARAGIKIGKNCLIASNVNIIDRNGHNLSMDNPSNRLNTIGNDTEAEILIEDNVWIGANCIITPGVKIGEGSVIMSNSVVNKDIPPYTLAGGVPCVILKTYKQN